MGLLIACVSWLLEGKRAHWTDGETENSVEETFFSGIKAVNDSVKRCTFSALCAGV